MTRTYKLTNRFNYVEFKIEDSDYENYLEEVAMKNSFIESEGSGEPLEYGMSFEEWLHYTLNFEMNALMSISIENEIPENVTIDRASNRIVEKATPDQIKTAHNLGIRSPEQYSKRDLWKMINDIQTQRKNDTPSPKQIELAHRLGIRNPECYSMDDLRLLIKSIINDKEN